VKSFKFAIGFFFIVIFSGNVFAQTPRSAADTYDLQKRLELVQAKAESAISPAYLNIAGYQARDEKWTITEWSKAVVTPIQYTGVAHIAVFLVTKVGTDNNGHSAIVGALVRIDWNGKGTVTALQANDPMLKALISFSRP
jgi:hypothetical protein